MTSTCAIGTFGRMRSSPRALGMIVENTVCVCTTRFAGRLDVTRRRAPEVGQVIQSVIEKGYRDFTGRAAKARDRTVEQIDEVARGRGWSGAQAKERGLVDAFGGLRDAIDDAATRAALGVESEYRVRYIEKMATDRKSTRLNSSH